jgi:hypothetical protein
VPFFEGIHPTKQKANKYREIEQLEEFLPDLSMGNFARMTV